MVFSALEGWSMAKNLVIGKEDDAALRRGGSRISALIVQIAYQCLFLEHLAKCVQAKQKYEILLIPPLSFAADFLLRDLDERGFARSHPNLRKGIRWITDQCLRMLSLYQIVFIGTSVLLLFRGHRAYAATSLGVICVEYLKKQKLLSERVAEVYEKITPWFSLGGSLLNATLSMGSIALNSLVLLEMYTLFSKMQFSPKKLSYDSLKHPSKLTWLQFQSIINQSATVTVNKEHVLIEPFPIFESRGFDSLVEMGNNFRWEDAFDDLNRKLEKDPRWKASEEYEEILSTELSEDAIKMLKIRYAKKQFLALVDSIQDETIETGTPLNYDVLRNYLNCIAQKLPRASVDLMTQVMLQLAVEGADYCGTGIYYQLETAATALLRVSDTVDKKRLPLKQRILMILQQERIRVIEAYYQLLKQINPIVVEVRGGDGNVHALNYVGKLLGHEEFGLPDHGAEGDTVSDVVFFEKKVVDLMPGFKGLWTDFENEKVGKIQGYNERRIVEAIKGYIGISMLPASDVREWAQSWIKTTGVDEETKETFLEQLGDGETFESNLQFRNEFLFAMLVDMNILARSN